MASAETARLVLAGTRRHLLLKGARKSFSWKDYRDLLVRAHIRLGGPIMVVWDSLNSHLAARLKRYEAEHDWLNHRPPPAVRARSQPKGSGHSCGTMANTAFETPDDSTAHSAESYAETLVCDDKSAFAHRDPLPAPRCLDGTAEA
ncbi:hypothetical protein ACFU5O_33730 [Streptomyces sp. NPDC057445]|uniref:hypothetical protein n=1 Tax=Streptomyces sp. NPDC057445 TaxID=3346136 RepID=UPI0036B7BA8D